ncbi:MAG TPA: ribosome maturation factor RimM [bacterium]|nr:ribosome maturation factor RimM [bacterium]
MPTPVRNPRRIGISGSRVAVGKITRPHGLRGALHVFPYAQNLMDSLPMEEIFLEPEGGQRLAVREVRLQNSNLILSFWDIDTLERAQFLVQRELWAEKSSFVPLPPGDYYWFEIEGLAVQSVEGECLGIIQEILETGSNDVYVVQGERGEILVPAIRDFIERIDVEAGIVTIRNLSGLLDYAD